jgi:hypothetical protein
MGIEGCFDNVTADMDPGRGGTDKISAKKRILTNIGVFS